MTILALLRGPGASHNPARLARELFRRGSFGSGSFGIIKEGPVVLAAFARRACLIVVLSLVPASVLAQGASTATIAGVVKDASGAVLPGVTVEAASPALIEKVRATVTDDRGEYRLPELRPGSYSLTFSLAGFSTLRRDGL